MPRKIESLLRITIVNQLTSSLNILTLKQIVLFSKLKLILILKFKSKYPYIEHSHNLAMARTQKKRIIKKAK